MNLNELDPADFRAIAHMLDPADLRAIAHLLRAAYHHAVTIQHGWEGPLAEVDALALRYEQAARDRKTDR